MPPTPEAQRTARPSAVAPAGHQQHQQRSDQGRDDQAYREAIRPDQDGGAERNADRRAHRHIPTSCRSERRQAMGSRPTAAIASMISNSGVAATALRCDRCGKSGENGPPGTYAVPFISF
jgi:hypothetical protein